MTTPTSLSEAFIANMALARIGVNARITDLATDVSPEGAQAAIWYPQDRDALLCDFPWPWAEGYFQLDQVAGPEINQQVANAQWSRTYRYPSDCLKLRRIVVTPPPFNGSNPPQTTGLTSFNAWCNEPWKRADGQPYPISYSVTQDSIGRLIQTDAVGVGFGLTAVYTRAVEDPSQFSNDFADLLAWRLAADLGMALAIDERKRAYAEQQYERVVKKARATHLNETQSDIPLVRYQSEAIRARQDWGMY